MASIDPSDSATATDGLAVVGRKGDPCHCVLWAMDSSFMGTDRGVMSVEGVKTSSQPPLSMHCNARESPRHHRSAAPADLQLLC